MRANTCAGCRSTASASSTSPATATTATTCSPRTTRRLRLVAALREDFPLVEKLLGAEGFSALASSYAAAYPSDHFSLGRFGRAFDTFLRERPARWRRDLADLAALEWARAEVFVERDA